MKKILILIFLFQLHYLDTQSQIDCSTFDELIVHQTNLLDPLTLDIKIGSRTEYISNVCENYSSLNLVFDWETIGQDVNHTVTISFNFANDQNGNPIQVYEFLTSSNLDLVTIAPNGNSITITKFIPDGVSDCSSLSLAVIDFVSSPLGSYDLAFNISSDIPTSESFIDVTPWTNGNIPRFYKIIDSPTLISSTLSTSNGDCFAFNGKNGYYIKDGGELILDNDMCITNNIRSDIEKGLVFAPGGKLSVLNGYELRIENANVDVCPNMTGQWETIEVEPGAKVTILDSDVQNAETALTMRLFN